MSDDPKYQFKGVWIPKTVWLHPDLTWMEKCLLGEIWALDGDEGCYATNEFLAERFNSSEKSISNQIAKLRKLGLVHIESFNGRRRVMRALMDAASTAQWMQNPPPDGGSINPPVEEREQRENKENNTGTAGGADADLFADVDGNAVAPSAASKATGTAQELAAYAVEIGLRDSDGTWMHDKLTASGWKLARGGKLKDWRAHMRTYKTSGWFPSQNQSHETKNSRATPARNPSLLPHKRPNKPETRTFIDNRPKANYGRPQ